MNGSTEEKKVEPREDCCKQGACFRGCCFVRKEVKQVPKDFVGTTESQSAVVAEKAFDATVKNIKSNLSWASSGLLGTATAATISISFGSDGWEAVLAGWVYVIILVIIEVSLQTVTLDVLDTPDSVGKELDTTVPPKKAALGDEVAKYELDQKIQKQKEKETDRSSKGIAMRIVQFAERTTDQFLENLASLATAIFANVIAIALNTTVKDTFEWIINNQDLTIALYWLFSMIVTLIACYVALKTGAAMDKAEIELYDFVYKTAQEQNIKKKSDIWTNEHVDQTVIKFAARRRFVNLINYTLGLTMAWSWRDALKYTIINAYGGDTDSETLSGLWIYVLFASLMVGFVNSLAEKYYFLYPKDADSGLQLESKERKFIGNAIYKNAQCVVGIAWHDALVESSDVICSGWTNVAVLWLASVLGSYYWQSIWLRFEMLEKGIVSAIYNAFDHLYDNDKVLENDEEEKKKASKSYEFSVLYAKELIELTIAAWGVAAGWTAPSAIKAMLIEIYDGTYDPDTTDDVSGEVLWSVWIAFVIALLVSTAIMRVLSSIQEKKKAARREAMKKIAGVDKDANEKDLEVDVSGDNEKGKENAGTTEMENVISDSAQEDNGNGGDEKQKEDETTTDA